MIPPLVILFALFFIALRRPGTAQETAMKECKTSLETALKTKADVFDAFKHPVLGPVDFRWGNKAGGICHIAHKHPEDIDDLPEILVTGTIKHGKTRTFITNGSFTVVLAKNFFGKPSNHWVITGYKKDADE